jgi:hypothetical protein
VRLSGVTYEFQARRAYPGEEAPATFVAGLGLARIGQALEGGAMRREWAIAYARVNGQSFGRPVPVVAAERFLPSALHDEWEFAVQRITCNAGGPACVTDERIERYKVVGDTLLGSARLPVYAAYGSGRCAMGVRPGDRWPVGQPLDAAGWCPPLVDPGLPYDFVSDRPGQPRRVTVGDETHTVAGRRIIGHVDAVGYQQRYGADIGLVYHITRDPLSSGGSIRVVYRLQAARVGGIQYGEFGRPPGPLPGPGGVLLEPAITVRPNPARALASAVLHNPTGGAATIEVVDILGRRVLRLDVADSAAGVSEHVLDLASLAPGVYVVQATTTGGVVSTPFVRYD